VCVRGRILTNGTISWELKKEWRTMETIRWQLIMFQKTLKKKMRLKNLKNHIGHLAGDAKCLFITCGDNNGAMNYYLRELGGQWQWADLEKKSISDIEELLEEKVHHVSPEKMPFADDSFDLVISVDVHEHLTEPAGFTRELYRVSRANGRVIVTVPNGDERKIATRIKNAIGMTKEKYGHVREGYDLPELRELLIGARFTPGMESSFSRLFTELLELSLNFLYVNFLAKKSKAPVEKGTIAPATRDQLESVKKTYRFYSLIYPLFWLISKFDVLVLYTRGYVVMVSGRKEA
jgi:SAM-dependent methyltransferase